MNHVPLKLVALAVAMIPWAGIAAAIMWIFRRWRIRVAIVGPEQQKENLGRADSRREGEPIP